MEEDIHTDDKFYMTLVTFKVENRLFKVPRSTLESQSNVFRDMFSLPTPNRDLLEGSSDEKPIHLDGIKADEFKLLLGALFTSAVGSQDDLPSSPEEWLMVIKLARMWEFDDVLRNSIDRIQYHSVKMRPVEKVALALQYDMQEWLVPGLDELAKRSEPIGIEDVNLLGLDVALKVAAVRESLRMGTKIVGAQPWTSQLPCLISGPRDASEIDFTHTVKKIFQIS